VTRERSGFSKLFADASAVGGAARDFIRARVRRDQHTVAMYDGFGEGDRVFIQGRALEDEGIAPASVDHTRWQNALALLRRAEADPIEHATVRMTVGSAVQDFITDAEGFFSGWMPGAGAERIDEDWVRSRGELMSQRGDDPVRSEGRVLLPVKRPEFLVISDIDDTVLQSNVTSFLRAATTVLFHNARTRLPFPGVAAFYHALRRGPTGQGTNPTFYVSSSPWNLYDVITEFLAIQGIPAGPMMLRNVDLGLASLRSGHHHVHKRAMIHHVLSTYAAAPAILIGDSGQQDPEIYRDVVHEYTGRIKAVYIRNVAPNDARKRAIEGLAGEVLKAGSSLVLADDTLAIAKHAVENGFISADTLGAIGEEKRADEGKTSEKKDAPGAQDAGDKPTPTIVVE
jgi:phosphatidate phosphatase APP1